MWGPGYPPPGGPYPPPGGPYPPPGGYMPPPGGYGPPPPGAYGYGPPPGGMPPGNIQQGYPPNAPMPATGYPAPGSGPTPSAPPIEALPPYHSPGSIAQGAGANPYQGNSAPTPQAAVPPPLPAMQQPMPAPFQPTGRKRALLVGCNYRGAPFALNGCINDAMCLKHLLKSRLGFREEDIMLLTDDQPNPQRWPTRQNMLYQMQMLVWDLRPGDSLFFSFSGHGSQTRDYSGDENDGLNETICPCDFKLAGQIVDDELNRLLVNPLPPGVRLHAIIDACHSGSAMDLEFRSKFKPGRGVYWKQEYSRRPSVYKGTRGGECIQFGAARDSQTAADTNRLSGTVSTGAATFSFIQAIERNGTGVSYGRLLEEMYRSIASVSGAPAMPALGGGMLDSLLGGVMGFAGAGGQTPCLCANTAFDLNRPLAI